MSNPRSPARRLAAAALLAALPATLPAALHAQDVQLRTPPGRPFDVTHIDLDLLVDLPGERVEGWALVSLKALRPQGRRFLAT